LLKNLRSLIEDLALELAPHERYRRLLAAMRSVLPCDAAALLRLEQDRLVPVAVDGLSDDTLGRRFRVAEHPRFQRLLESTSPVLFESDSPLPDPYDGLVSGVDGGLPVHDCMGCVLLVDGSPWGLVTLDSLQEGRFSPTHIESLKTFAGLAAASVAAARRMDELTAKAEAERKRAETFQLAAAPVRRDLIGQSAAMKELRREIGLAGPSDLCVLIFGETGTGKELVAQALHTQSSRASRPMVVINCAALPDQLVESELFGHVRGAFTGAMSDRLGKFELAHGSTLFLDEVGELPLSAQAKLLRVLQSGQVQRLGSDRDHQVDVRLIAASNRSLQDEVRAGRLRADFYHRLSVFPVRVPPLRERQRDVLVLAGYFLEELRAQLGVGGVRLDSSAVDAMLAYEWPGNVRELEHLLSRSVVRAAGASPVARKRTLTLSASDLGLTAMAGSSTALRSPQETATLTGPQVSFEGGPHAGSGMREALDRFQKQLIENALEKHGHQWAAAARELHLDSANLIRMAKRLGMTSKRDARLDAIARRKVGESG